ncbi:MAG: hypothetical protein M3416_00725 [Acidobacteriota bacterium]|nr:hypothetical protein [Acidobacteriota bacterium]
MTPELSILINDPNTRKIFDEIVKKRKVRLKDLASCLGEEKSTREDLIRTINELKSAELIQELGAPTKAHQSVYEGFKTYYVTSNGLSAERQLRRLMR